MALSSLVSCCPFLYRNIKAQFQHMPGPGVHRYIFFLSCALSHGASKPACAETVTYSPETGPISLQSRLLQQAPTTHSASIEARPGYIRQLELRSILIFTFRISRETTCCWYALALALQLWLWLQIGSGPASTRARVRARARTHAQGRLWARVAETSSDVAAPETYYTSVD